MKLIPENFNCFVEISLQLVAKFKNTKMFKMLLGTTNYCVFFKVFANEVAMILKNIRNKNVSGNDGFNKEVLNIV